MFNTFAYAAVDAVQDLKTKFVTTFVKHEGISNVMNSFIEAQANYTKSAIDAGLESMTSLGNIMKQSAMPTAPAKKASR